MLCGVVQACASRYVFAAFMSQLKYVCDAFAFSDVFKVQPERLNEPSERRLLLGAWNDVTCIFLEAFDLSRFAASSFLQNPSHLIWDGGIFEVCRHTQVLPLESSPNNISMGAYIWGGRTSPERVDHHSKK